MAERKIETLSDLLKAGGTELGDGRKLTRREELEAELERKIAEDSNLGKLVEEVLGRLSGAAAGAGVGRAVLGDATSEAVAELQKDVLKETAKEAGAAREAERLTRAGKEKARSVSKDIKSRSSKMGRTLKLDDAARVRGLNAELAELVAEEAIKRGQPEMFEASEDAIKSRKAQRSRPPELPSEARENIEGQKSLRDSTAKELNKEARKLEKLERGFNKSGRTAERMGTRNLRFLSRAVPKARTIGAAGGAALGLMAFDLIKQAMDLITEDTDKPFGERLEKKLIENTEQSLEALTGPIPIDDLVK